MSQPTDPFDMVGPPEWEGDAAADMTEMLEVYAPKFGQSYPGPAKPPMEVEHMGVWPTPSPLQWAEMKESLEVATAKLKAAIEAGHVIMPSNPGPPSMIQDIMAKQWLAGWSYDPAPIVDLPSVPPSNHSHGPIIHDFGDFGEKAVTGMYPPVGQHSIAGFGTATHEALVKWMDNHQVSAGQDPVDISEEEPMPATDADGPEGFIVTGGPEPFSSEEFMVVTEQKGWNHGNAKQWLAAAYGVKLSSLNGLSLPDQMHEIAKAKGCKWPQAFLILAAKVGTPLTQFPKNGLPFDVDAAIAAGMTHIEQSGAAAMPTVKETVSVNLDEEGPVKITVEVPVEMVTETVGEPIPSTTVWCIVHGCNRTESLPDPHFDLGDGLTNRQRVITFWCTAGINDQWWQLVRPIDIAKMRAAPSSLQWTPAEAEYAEPGPWMACPDCAATVTLWMPPTEDVPF